MRRAIIVHAATIALFAAVAGLAGYVTIEMPSAAPYIALCMVLLTPLGYLACSWGGSPLSDYWVQLSASHGANAHDHRYTADLLLAGLLLLVAVPYLAFAAISRVVRKKPILMRLPTWGMNGEPFLMWKFSDDPPDTASGVKLGPVSLRQRLPALLNVFTGDMRIFGPRPVEIGDFREPVLRYPLRFRVRPGVLSVSDVFRYEFDPRAKRFVENRDIERMLGIEEETVPRLSAYGNAMLVLKMCTLLVLRHLPEPLMTAILGRTWTTEGRLATAERVSLRRISLFEVMNSAFHPILAPVYVVIFLAVAGSLILIWNAVMGRATPRGFLPFVLSGASLIDILRYYGVSIGIGAAFAMWAKIVDFKFSCSEGDGAKRARAKLFWTGITVGGLAIEDNFIGRGALGFVAIAAAFVLCYLMSTRSTLRTLNAGPNLTDAGAMISIGQDHFETHLAEQLFRDLRRGAVFRAYQRLQYSPPADRNAMKLEAMTYLRLRLYRRVQKVADQHNALLRAVEGLPSETLLSMKAIAEVHLGMSSGAEKTLLFAEELFPRNPYFLYHRSYVYWQRGDLESALDLVARAIDMIGGEERPVTLSMLALKTHILCDLAVFEYRVHRQSSRARIADADRVIRIARLHAEAVTRNTAIRFGNHIDYLTGYASMLAGRYNEAVAFFSQCVWESNHPAAMYRMAVLRAIGSEDYDGSIQSLLRILNTIRVAHAVREVVEADEGPEHTVRDYQNRFEDSIRQALSHILAAKERRVIFDEQIIYSDEERFPEFAVADSSLRQAGARVVSEIVAAGHAVSRIAFRGVQVKTRNIAAEMHVKARSIGADIRARYASSGVVR